MLKKIISGGLPGVEAAALDAAIRLDIPHEGWTYKSRKTENDDVQKQYNLKEIANPSYFERLEKNIIDSEGTVILSYGQLLIGLKGVRVNLPQFDGHFKKDTIDLKGVSNEKEKAIHTRVQIRSSKVVGGRPKASG